MVGMRLNRLIEEEYIQIVTVSNLIKPTNFYQNFHLRKTA